MLYWHFFPLSYLYFHLWKSLEANFLHIYDFEIFTVFSFIISFEYVRSLSFYLSLWCWFSLFLYECYLASMHKKLERERERIYLLFCLLSLSACSLHVYDLLPVVSVFCTYIYILDCMHHLIFLLVKNTEMMHEKKTLFCICLDIFCYFIYCVFDYRQ